MNHVARCGYFLRLVKLKRKEVPVIKITNDKSIKAIDSSEKIRGVKFSDGIIDVLVIENDHLAQYRANVITSTNSRTPIIIIEDFLGTMEMSYTPL